MLSSVGVVSRVEIGGLSRYLCIPVQGRGIGSSMGRRDFKLTSGESTHTRSKILVSTGLP